MKSKGFIPGGRGGGKTFMQYRLFESFTKAVEKTEKHKIKCECCNKLFLVHVGFLDELPSIDYKPTILDRYAYRQMNGYQKMYEHENPDEDSVIHLYMRTWQFEDSWDDIASGDSCQWHKQVQHDTIQGISADFITIDEAHNL